MTTIDGVKLQFDCHGNQTVVKGNTLARGGDSLENDSVGRRGRDVCLVERIIVQQVEYTILFDHEYIVKYTASLCPIMLGIVLVDATGQPHPL